MEDEDIDDLIGNVTYSDSQKSIPVEIFPCDVTEASMDQFNSSGKGTYILEIDDSDESESESLCNAKYITPCLNIQRIESCKSLRLSSNRYQHPLGRAQESFTQTSKTIIQVAKAELLSSGNVASSETQTSFYCIKENKTIERTINCKCLYNAETHNFNFGHLFSNVVNDSLDDSSSNFPAADTENEGTYVVSDMGTEFTKKTFEMSEINACEAKRDTHINRKNKLQKPNTVNFFKSDARDSQKSDSEYEEDSLINDEPEYLYDMSDTSEVPQSVDNDVNEIYSKLADTIIPNKSIPNDLNDRYKKEEDIKSDKLIPLIEESTRKLPTYLTDNTSLKCANPIVNDKPDFLLFSDKDGIQVKLLHKDNHTNKTEEPLKLPPITDKATTANYSHLKTLLKLSQPFSKEDPQPCLFKVQKENLDNLSWKIGNLDFASGENVHIERKLDSDRNSENNLRYLPPIQAIVGHARTISSARENSYKSNVSSTSRLSPSIDSKLPITIQDKIRELKMSRTWMPASTLPNPTPGRHRCSPNASLRSNTGDAEAATERACDLLCLELLKHLRSNNWFEVADALDELPNTMNKFWDYMSEQRIADLIRQICSHTESPRTQVAKSACAAIAELLKNTKYTKKPDFYEAITVLLYKTGSYSRMVRRAANLALDKIVSSVDLSHAISALCIHGAEHKSPLVRSAAARLLVVCAALSGGGRELLRTRPLGAATARRFALRALSTLLDDKNIEARKYAERLYSMLRPLAHFEAYYLTDVNVERASVQMRKYDQLLMSEKPGDDAW